MATERAGGAAPIDMTVPAKEHARAALSAIEGLAVYGRRAKRKMEIPSATLRKVGEEGYDYLDDPGRPSVAVLRVELRAASDAECDRLAGEIDDALRAGGRMYDRSQYYEGVETDSGSESGGSALYRLTLQYRIAEI